MDCYDVQILKYSNIRMNSIRNCKSLLVSDILICWHKYMQCVPKNPGLLGTVIAFLIFVAETY